MPAILTAAYKMNNFNGVTAGKFPSFKLGFPYDFQILFNGNQDRIDLQIREKLRNCSTFR